MVYRWKPMWISKNEYSQDEKSDDSQENITYSMETFFFPFCTLSSSYVILNTSALSLWVKLYL
jgi:hypothetical protein